MLTPVGTAAATTWHGAVARTTALVLGPQVLWLLRRRRIGVGGPLRRLQHLNHHLGGGRARRLEVDAEGGRLDQLLPVEVHVDGNAAVGRNPLAVLDHSLVALVEHFLQHRLRVLCLLRCVRWRHLVERMRRRVLLPLLPLGAARHLRRLRRLLPRLVLAPRRPHPAARQRLRFQLPPLRQLRLKRAARLTALHDGLQKHRLDELRRRRKPRLLSGAVSVCQVERADERLEHVGLPFVRPAALLGVDRAVQLRAFGQAALTLGVEVGNPLARVEQEFREVEPVRRNREHVVADDQLLAQRERTLVVVREAFVQLLGDDQIEQSVAQPFHPLKLVRHLRTIAPRPPHKLASLELVVEGRRWRRWQWRRWRRTP